ncbi:hypothetical protein PT974_10408 [Cladobotryum mycophilum]|uniref:Uncharacterized protein n=1 Tax=Cladobotryum mycophilum TaxID=491253 RepID=A0ABR0SB76_9HYPO
MKFSICFVATLAGFTNVVNAAPPATAVELEPAGTRCEVICIDAINDCKQFWGGCYNPCYEQAPTPPPCMTTAKPIATALSQKPTDDCRTRTVCVDAINKCGVRYGACIPDCKPWSISAPPCSLETQTIATLTSKVITAHVTSSPIPWI